MVSRCLHLIFAPSGILFPHRSTGLVSLSSSGHFSNIPCKWDIPWPVSKWNTPLMNNAYIPFPWLLFHCLYHHVTILYNLYFLSTLILYYVNLPSPKNKLHEGRDLEETDSEADTMSECKDRIWKQLTWLKELGGTQKQPEPKYWIMDFSASIQRTECNSSSGLSPELSFYHAFQQQAFSLVSFSQMYSIEKQKLTKFYFLIRFREENDLICFDLCFTSSRNTNLSPRYSFQPNFILLFGFSIWKKKYLLMQRKF